MALINRYAVKQDQEQKMTKRHKTDPIVVAVIDETGPFAPHQYPESDFITVIQINQVKRAAAVIRLIHRFLIMIDKKCRPWK